VTPSPRSSPPDAGGSGDDSKYHVRAVGRALEFLDLLGSDTGGGGLSLTEVADRVSVSKSAAFATLFTLAESGFVATTGEGATKRYRLGPALIRLGAHARAQISLSDLARPYLIELTRELHATSRLAVLESDNVVVIDQVSASVAHGRDLRMGSRELLHSTGLGKAILSALPERQVRSMLEVAGLPARTANTITDPDDLLLHLRKIAHVGYAIDDEEDAEGVFCIGSPIRDHSGACLGAISVTGVKLHQPAAFYRSLGRRVGLSAGTISTALGYVAKTV
jgi:IclR family acetate operon transcriptional repressor